MDNSSSQIQFVSSDSLKAQLPEKVATLPLDVSPQATLKPWLIGIITTYIPMEPHLVNLSMVKPVSKSLEKYFNKIISYSKDQILLTDQRFKFDGDNLLINNITYKEAGRYMCEAKQDIEKGSTDMRTIDVNVQRKSTFNALFKKLHVFLHIPNLQFENFQINHTQLKIIPFLRKNSTRLSKYLVK